MPEISRFLGIVVTIYYNDHAPPHFHVRYGASRATIAIATCTLLEGSFPPRALGLALEWAARSIAPSPKRTGTWRAISNL
jgi:hypothetical protein